MELTGKCKIDFRKWLVLSDLREQIEKFCKLNLNDTITEAFMELPDSMKFGVLANFFDSVGIEIEIERVSNDAWTFAIYHKGGKFELKLSEIYKTRTRPKARTKAIKKANKIRNEQL